MNPKLVLRLAGQPRLRVDGEQYYSVSKYVLKHAVHTTDPQKLSANILTRLRAQSVHVVRRMHVPRSGIGPRTTPCTTLEGMLAVRRLVHASVERSRKCTHGYKKGKYYCPQCRGNGRCAHGQRREWCPECDPVGYITKRTRHAIYMGLRQGGKRKQKRTLSYLGVESFSDVVAHLQRKMDTYNATHPPVEMTWRNIVLDHIKPKAEFVRQGGVDDDLHHYTNMQPLLAEHNLRKSDYWSAEADAFWRTHIIHHSGFCDLFVPSRACTTTDPAVDGNASVVGGDCDAVGAEDGRAAVKRERHVADVRAIVFAHRTYVPAGHAEGLGLVDVVVGLDPATVADADAGTTGVAVAPDHGAATTDSPGTGYMF